MTFEVTPTIMSGKDASGRKLINFTLDLQKNAIKTFDSWYKYDARTYNSDGSVEGEYYYKPVFNERRFKTHVTVFDGETTLAGGITIDTNDIVHDKVPILGDIPFIGRFFQSKYTKATKSNLLIFVTCRLVKPDGTPLYPNSIVEHGTFDFGRSY